MNLIYEAEYYERLQNYQTLSLNELWEILEYKFFFKEIELCIGSYDVNRTERIWKCISCFNFLTDEFMEKYQDKLDWRFICKNQKLSEEFMEKHLDKMSWDNVSKYQKLSEDFLENFHHQLNWDDISMYQKLSEDFMIKYINEIRFESILWNVNIILTNEFKILLKLKGLI